MKVIERSQATEALADYAAQIAAGPVVLTENGEPIAALVSIENADLETISLSTNPEFIEIIQQSLQRAQREGGIPSDDMRRRFH